MLIEGRENSLIFILIASAVIYYYSYMGKKGKVPQIRRLPAIDAIEEAVARCAELGRPAHFTAGMGHLRTDTGPQTIAGLDILGYMSKICARLGVPIIASVCNPETLPLHEEVIRQGYILEGVPEEFNPDYSIRYLSNQQKSYASGVIGVMQRDKPACNIVIGPLYGEIYTLLEAGRPVGAFTVGGTARIIQVSVVAIMSDYTLIGEDLYAAGAYISEDPEVKGQIAGKDMLKWICLATLILGVLGRFVGFDLSTLLS